jgi:hypothetical protein
MIAETYALIEKDLKAAATMLPDKSGYSSADLGRATKGAANGYLTRAIMYQLGTDNTDKHTWQEVYDLTSTIITSNQYGLLANYAAIHQDIGKNSSESLFEIQVATPWLAAHTPEQSLEKPRATACSAGLFAGR